ncbi:MAG: hypothetical protein JWL95_342 [Gemmatimonadetes bacterium]|nr:hypothetical protein [Gemmatimonadota bacterium]
MRLVEIDDDGDVRLLYGPGSKASTREPTGRPHREIDRRSSLRIEYDVAAVRELNGLGVDIEASVQGQRVNIPGYSVVGEKVTSAGATILGFERSAGLAKTVNDHASKMVDLFNQTIARFSRDDSTSRLRAYAVQSEARQARFKAYSDSLTFVQRIAKQRTSLDSILRLSPSPDSSRVFAERGAAIVRETAVALDTLRLLSAALTVATRTVASADSVVASLNRRTLTRDQLDSLIAILRADATLAGLAKMLADTSGQSFADAVAHGGLIAPIVYNGTVQRFANELAQLPTSSRDPNTDSLSLQRHLFDLRDAASELSPLLVQMGPTEWNRALAASLRETSFSVSSLGAKVGEDILLTLSSTVDGHERRSVTIVLSVAEHGIIPRITDSFLFVRRVGIAGTDEAQLVQQYLADYTKLPAVQKQLASNTIEVPLGENYTAAPGVNFGWVYLPRDPDDNAPWYTSAFKATLRGIKAGWGINASFPSFSTKQIKVTPATLDAAGKETAPDKIEGQTIEKQSLGLSAGPYLSLFEGALTASYGWNLTTTTKRQYFALGLSFIGLAKQGTDLLEKFKQK